MARRGVNYYLLKTMRVSGWVLIPMVLLYLGTGYASCGKLGMDRLIESETGLELHRIMDRPLILLFVLHASTAAYFSMRRWGWIKTRKKA